MLLFWGASPHRREWLWLTTQAILILLSFLLRFEGFMGAQFYPVERKVHYKLISFIKTLQFDCLAGRH